MARYKRVRTITLNALKYPESVENCNKIAKEQDRPVHEVVDKILRELHTNASNSDNLCQEKKVVA